VVLEVAGLNKVGGVVVVVFSVVVVLEALLSGGAEKTHPPNAKVPPRSEIPRARRVPNLWLIIIILQWKGLLADGGRRRLFGRRDSRWGRRRLHNRRGRALRDGAIRIPVGRLLGS
jgi:hypothetical protein